MIRFGLFLFFGFVSIMVVNSFRFIQSFSRNEEYVLGCQNKNFRVSFDWILLFVFELICVVGEMGRFDWLG